MQDKSKTSDERAQQVARAKEYAAGLRRLAAMVEANPEQFGGGLWRIVDLIAYSSSSEEVAGVARAGLKAGATLASKASKDYAGIKLHFGPITLDSYTKVEHLSDPDALIAELLAERDAEAPATQPDEPLPSREEAIAQVAAETDEDLLADALDDPFGYAPGDDDPEESLREEYAGECADRDERASEPGFTAWLARQLVTARVDLARYADGAR